MKLDKSFNNNLSYKNEQFSTKKIPLCFSTDSEKQKDKKWSEKIFFFEEFFNSFALASSEESPELLYFFHFEDLKDSQLNFLVPKFTLDFSAVFEKLKLGKNCRIQNIKFDDEFFTIFLSPNFVVKIAKLFQSFVEAVKIYSVEDKDINSVTKVPKSFSLQNYSKSGQVECYADNANNILAILNAKKEKEEKFTFKKGKRCADIENIFDSKVQKLEDEKMNYKVKEDNLRVEKEKEKIREQLADLSGQFGALQEEIKLKEKNGFNLSKIVLIPDFDKFSAESLTEEYLLQKREIEAMLAAEKQTFLNVKKQLVGPYLHFQFVIEGFKNKMRIKSFPIRKEDHQPYTTDNHQNCEISSSFKRAKLKSLKNSSKHLLSSSKINANIKDKDKFKAQNFAGSEANKKEMQELFSQKPKEDLMVSEEVLQGLQKDYGRINLKCDLSDNSLDREVVFDDMRINASSIRESLAAYSKKIFSLKSAENQKLENLKEEKLKVYAKLSRINKLLESLSEPSIHFKYGDFDLTHILQNPSEEIIKHFYCNFVEEKETFMDFFENFRNNEDLVVQSIESRYKTDFETEKLIHLVNKWKKIDENSRKEEIRKKIAEKLNYIFASEIENFDRKIEYVFKNRIKIELEINSLDIFFLHLKKELTILQQYEEEENNLGEKLEDSISELNDIGNKIIVETENVNQLKYELEKLDGKEKELSTEIQRIAAEDSGGFGEYFNKVYRNNPKKNQAAQNVKLSMFDCRIKSGASRTRLSSSVKYNAELENFENQLENDENHNEGFLDFLFTSSTAVEDQDIQLTSCPSGCNISIYSEVMKMRDERIKIESEVKQKEESVELLLRDVETLKGQANHLEQIVENYENNLKTFELRKLKKLNEMEIFVHLESNQITGTLDSIPDKIIMTRKQLENFAERPQEIEKKNLAHKMNINEHHRLASQFQKAERLKRKEFEKILEETKLAEVQKFGKSVDLDAIIKMSQNKSIELLKEHLFKSQKLFENATNQTAKMKQSLEEKYLDYMKQESSLLEKLSDLKKMDALKKSQELKNCENDKKQSEISLSLERSEGTIKKYNSLIKKQQEELSRMNYEAKVLCRKDTNLYESIY